MNHLPRRQPRRFHLFQNHVRADENGWPCRDGIAAHPVFALPSMRANQKLEMPFLPEPDGQPILIPPGLFPSPLQFLPKSARPAARIYFHPMLSDMISPPNRAVCRPKTRTPRPCVPVARMPPLVFFCAASSTALRYSAFCCRRMAVSWPDLKLECCSKIRSASPRATEACCPVSPDKMIRASFAESNNLFMSSIPTAPASSSTTSLSLDKGCLDSNRLCSVFASNPSLRRTSVAAAVGVQKAVQSSPLSGGDQFTQCRGFAAACQSFESGNAVGGPQDMVNRPALIFAQPVGRPIAGMQRRDRSQPALTV